MNLPNALTVLRILLVPVLGWLLLYDDGNNNTMRVWAFVVFFVAILTDHSDIDYEDVVARSQLVVDFRNATKAVAPREGKVWKL